MPPSQSPAPRHRLRAARRILVAVAAGAALLLSGPAASAHVTLTDSSPRHQSSGPPPEEIVLTFSGPVNDLGAAVEVAGPEGSVSGADPEVTGTTLTVALPPDLPAGDYDVTWRVTAADGHPISGEFFFQVEAAAEPSSPATATATDPPATATDQPATETEQPAVTAVQPEATEEPTDQGSSEADEEGGVPAWMWLVAAAILLGLAGVTVAASRRRG